MARLLKKGLLHLDSLPFEEFHEISREMEFQPIPAGRRGRPRKSQAGRGGHKRKKGMVFHPRQKGPTRAEQNRQLLRNKRQREEKENKERDDRMDEEFFFQDEEKAREERDTEYQLNEDDIEELQDMNPEQEDFPEFKEPRQRERKINIDDPDSGLDKKHIGLTPEKKRQDFTDIWGENNPNNPADPNYQPPLPPPPPPPPAPPQGVGTGPPPAPIPPPPFGAGPGGNAAQFQQYMQRACHNGIPNTNPNADVPPFFAGNAPPGPPLPSREEYELEQRGEENEQQNFVADADEEVYQQGQQHQQDQPQDQPVDYAWGQELNQPDQDAKEEDKEDLFHSRQPPHQPPSLRPESKEQDLLRNMTTSPPPPEEKKEAWNFPLGLRMTGQAFFKETIAVDIKRFPDVKNFWLTNEYIQFIRDVNEHITELSYEEKVKTLYSLFHQIDMGNATNRQKTNRIEGKETKNKISYPPFDKKDKLYHPVHAKYINKWAAEHLKDYKKEFKLNRNIVLILESKFMIPTTYADPSYGIENEEKYKKHPKYKDWKNANFYVQEFIIKGLNQLFTFLRGMISIHKKLPPEAVTPNMYGLIYGAFSRVLYMKNVDYMNPFRFTESCLFTYQAEEMLRHLNVYHQPIFPIKDPKLLTTAHLKELYESPQLESIILNSPRQHIPLGYSIAHNLKNAPINFRGVSDE